MQKKFKDAEEQMKTISYVRGRKVSYKKSHNLETVGRRHNL